MEKKLLIGAIALFLLESFIFLADLGILPVPLFYQETITNSQPTIGIVEKTRETVRRKSMNSIFWESTENKDALKAYDSVLTLENSSAVLKLENDIQLNLNGNTLVVLEPIENQGQKRFRIQFQKGNIRSRSKNSDFQMTANDWVLEAKKGTDVAVTNLSDNDIQIEVVAGEAQLKKSNSEKVTKVSSGHRVALSNTSITDSVKISNQLQWEFENELLKKYSHFFPAPVSLSWSGSATELRIVKPGHSPEILKLDKNSQSLEREFFSGTYFLTMQNGNNTSRSLTLKILPAAKTRYLHPLPRDRNDASHRLTFSWLPNPDIYIYELQLSRTAEFHSVVESYSTKETRASITADSTGLLYWRIQGKDADGFQVPEFYIYPIYNISDPLSPPQLRTPLERQPAEKSKKNSAVDLKIKKWLNALKKVIIPSAHAEELSDKKNEAKKTVIFSWYKVPEADYYVIEIAVSKDFLNPLVIQKVNSTEFSWSDFEYNTYYYRVAAGQNNGRMGLFSAPEEANLSFLDTEVASKELQPGVHLSIEKIKNKVKKSQKIKNKTDIEQTASMSEQSVVQRSPTKPVPSFEKHETQWTASLFWAGGYIINSHSSMNAVKANHNGFSVKRFGLNITIPLRTSGHLALHTEYNENDWNPDTKKLPFQSQLIQKSMYHALMFAPMSSPSPYGIFYETIGIAKRTGDESLSLSEIEIYGIVTTTGYNFFSHWNTKHTLGVGYGDPYFVLHSDNYVFYQLDLWGENTGDTGIEFNIKYGQGSSSINFINSQVMYRLGFEF